MTDKNRNKIIAGASAIIHDVLNEVEAIMTVDCASSVVTAYFGPSAAQGKSTPPTTQQRLDHMLMDAGEFNKTYAFRKKMIEVGQEFTFDMIRPGSRGEILFCFKPVDFQEYNHIELREKDVDVMFPSFASELSSAFCEAGAVGSEPDQFFSPTEDISELLNQIISFSVTLNEQIEKREAELKAAEEKAALEALSEIPGWGSF